MSYILTILLRVFGLSALISCGIVFGAPLLNIPANTTTATIGVFLLPGTLALLLWWRQSLIVSGD
jgi:hypothetical protein